MVSEEHRALPYPEMLPCDWAGQERRPGPEKRSSRQQGPACGGNAAHAQRHEDYNWKALSSPSPAAPHPHPGRQEEEEGTAPPAQASAKCTLRMIWLKSMDSTSSD